MLLKVASILKHVTVFRDSRECTTVMIPLTEASVSQKTNVPSASTSAVHMNISKIASFHVGKKCVVQTVHPNVSLVMTHVGTTIANQCASVILDTSEINMVPASNHAPVVKTIPAVINVRGIWSGMIAVVIVMIFTAVLMEMVPVVVRMCIALMNVFHNANVHGEGSQQIQKLVA